MSPDHVFFVSSSDDKTVKVWDTARLERNVTSKPRFTYTQQHAKIKAVCMLEGVHCFATAADDGSLHIVRVHVGQSPPLPRYTKIHAIREYQTSRSGEYITCMTHYDSGVPLFLPSPLSKKLTRFRIDFQPCVCNHPFGDMSLGPADDASSTVDGASES